MAQEFHYADGSPIQEGDWVLLGHASTPARIVEVIGTPEQASRGSLQGLGVVVDGKAKGYVFLSEALLLEEPLLFVRRGPTEETRMALAVMMGLGVAVVLPALYSFFSALHSAWMTGEVLVISLGRTHTHTEMTSWQLGWARFAGPWVLVVSLLAFDGSRGVTLRWWMSGAGVLCGLILLGFSVWFTSSGRALVFAAVWSAMGMAWQLQQRRGRGAAFFFIAACASLCVWLVVRKG